MYDLLEDSKTVLFYVLLGERRLEAELWTFIECTLSLDEVTIVHQLPGPAHWSLSANHPLRTDFVLFAPCLKKQDSEGLKNFVLHHKLRSRIKICGWIFLLCWTAVWGAFWTLTFPLKLGIAVLLLWSLRKIHFLKSTLVTLFCLRQWVSDFTDIPGEPSCGWTELSLFTTRHWGTIHTLKTMILRNVCTHNNY